MYPTLPSRGQKAELQPYFKVDWEANTFTPPPHPAPLTLEDHSPHLLLSKIELEELLLEMKKSCGGAGVVWNTKQYKERGTDSEKVILALFLEKRFPI